MKLSSLIMVFVGSGLGGIVRYGISIFMAKSPEGAVPKATLCINIIACFILGAIMGKLQNFSSAEQPLYLLMAVGFCGGMSTFSTWSYEHLQLIQQGYYSTAILYILSSIILGCVATFLGFYFIPKMF